MICPIVTEGRRSRRVRTVTVAVSDPPGTADLRLGTLSSALKPIMLAACLGLLAASGLLNTRRPSKSAIVQERCSLLDRILASAKEVQSTQNCTASRLELSGFVGPKWTMAEETCFLYLLGRQSGGAIAEQGPFLGASTIAIASGIRDSAKPRRLFTTSDAFPAPASAYADGSMRHYPHYWRQYREAQYSGLPPFRKLTKDGGVAMHIDQKQLGTVPLSTYKANIAPFNSGPNGQMGTLVSNLHAARVSHMVSVMTGTRIPRDFPYEVVWSDSTHNVKEIERNVPALLRPAVMQAEVCSTLAFHDINPGWDSKRQIVAVNETSALSGARRAAIEKQLSRAGCSAVRRVAAGLIYAVTVRCS